MRLEITVVGGPGAPGSVPLQPAELSVIWPPGASPSGNSLEQALARRWEGSTFTVAGRPLSGLLAGTGPLVNGAVAVAWSDGKVEAGFLAGSGEAGGTVPGAVRGTEGGSEAMTGPVAGFGEMTGPVLGPGHSRRSVAVLVVTAGPGAGAVFGLHRGSYTVGRGRCRIRIADPSLSRHHCTLVVGSGGIVLTSVPGSRGMTIHAARPDGGPAPSASAVRNAVPVPVKSGVRVEVGQRIACGSSVMELCFQPPSASAPGTGVTSDAGSGSGGGASTGHGFSSDLLDAAALEPLEVPYPAGATRSKATLAATVAVPVIFGVVMALATGSWFFLSFAAMGVLTVFVPFLGGSARRKALRRAVENALSQDSVRRAAAFPDAGALVLAAHSGAAPPASTGRTAGMAVRLGTATQPAGVCLSPSENSFSAPAVAFSPLCLRLDTAATWVVGPGTGIHSLLNFVLMQLDAAGVPVVLLAPPQSLPLAARVLPLTTLATSTISALQALEPYLVDDPSGVPAASVVLLVLDAPLDASQLASPRVAVMHFSTLGPEGSGPLPPRSVVLTARGDRIVGATAGTDFVPDGVSNSVFAAYARRRALTVSRQDGARPAQAALRYLAANVLPAPGDCSPEAVRGNWSLSAGGPLRPVPLGMTASGPLTFDFRRDGPHLLLGGTTGSGKSELLRTLVGSLAAAHSPADLQFVFIDFKGGAGLGVLCKLPHTISLITDLGGHGMDRSLASLRAELHSRETALASAEASDSDEYRALVLARGCDPGAPPPNNHTMAHLVVVIDEFRVLVDQFPDAMAELMRIAAVGRSLGIHLVMATQRPQGALNADIRANVTSSICLRVQSVLDSVDVIGTAVAAAINVSTPGRAYLSRAGRAPQEFQSATLRLPAQGAAVLPLVESALDRLAGIATPPAATEEQASDAASVARLIERAWRQNVKDAGGSGRRSPAPAVVAPELPALLDMPDLPDLPDLPYLPNLPARLERPGGTDGTSSAAHRLVLGMVDVPQSQRLEPLVWNPGAQSHLACFGTVAETSRAVALAASRLLASNAHRGQSGGNPALLYLLDGDGSLEPYASTPWTGAHLMPGQLRAAAHLVQRLAGTVRSDSRQHLLCITDWARWVGALRSSPWHGSEDHLADLIRFSPPNMAVAAGGGRELLSATFLPAVPNRMFLSHGSNSELSMLWPRLPRFKPLPGRAAITGPINESAGSGLGTNTESQGEAPHVAQLLTASDSGKSAGGKSGGRNNGRENSGGEQPLRMVRVQELPSRLSLSELASHAGGATPHPQPGGRPESGPGTELLLGLGGDGLDPVFTFLAPGCVLPVIGGPRTGKSSFIRAMQQLHGPSNQNVAGAKDDADFSGGVAPSADAAAGRILWLDDAQALPSQQLTAAIAHLAAGGSIVAAFPYPGPALSMLPLEWGLRTAQQGIVLMPQRAGDGELFGIRLDTAGAEPPGRAALVERGRLQWLQLPLPNEITSPHEFP